MKTDIKHLAESFSSHKFEETLPYISNEVTWDLINGEVINGKEAVIKTCEESAKYLSNVKTTFKKFETYAGENFVVIDSLGEYIDEDKKKSVVASCDIYEFNENMIHKITSYTVEIPH